MTTQLCKQTTFKQIATHTRKIKVKMNVSVAVFFFITKKRLLKETEWLRASAEALRGERLCDNNVAKNCSRRPLCRNRCRFPLSPRCTAIFYPIRRPKHPLVQHDWFELGRLPSFCSEGYASATQRWGSILSSQSWRSKVTTRREKFDFL